MLRALAVAALAAASLTAVPAVAQNTGIPALATPEQVQQRNTQMQAMMDQAGRAKTPEERQKLMAEHMKAMREQMVAMRSMMGPGGMTGHHPAGAPEDTNVASQMQMMQQRMNMMQQMMYQMLQQQGLMMKPAP